ncbi:MAG: Nif3-like dinuclear metal center hexameric protein [Clostridiales bacterium]|jgi:dinuclear metal center YbgI/SA1388 family protein|nr:Nif3-like dinuclear metal center hexameric protein [Clostridiales bacterium]
MHNATVADIINLMGELAPTENTCDWDNSGLLVGEYNAPVKNVLVALDCTSETVKYAISKKAQLIITHHPVIFRAIKNITDKSANGSRLIELITHGVAVYSAHTNLDAADGGTNDTLFALLNLTEKENLILDNLPLGRIGKPENEPVSLEDFARFTAKALNTGGVSFVGNGEFLVKKIGICTGSASEAKYMDAAKYFGCDTYLTGDVSYHEAQYAADIGLNLVTAPHFATEAVITNVLQKKLNERLKSENLDVKIYVQKNQKDIFNYL